MSPARTRALVNALGYTGTIIVTALIIFVVLDVARIADVPADLITALTGLGSACGVGWIAGRIGCCILDRLDGLDTQLANLVADQAEDREAEQRIAEIRADSTAAANGNEVARLRSVEG
jgi:hypothetical protein